MDHLAARAAGSQENHPILPALAAVLFGQTAESAQQPANVVRAERFLVDEDDSSVMPPDLGPFFQQRRDRPAVVGDQHTLVRQGDLQELIIRCAEVVTREPVA